MRLEAGWREDYKSARRVTRKSIREGSQKGIREEIREELIHEIMEELMGEMRGSASVWRSDATFMGMHRHLDVAVILTDCAIGGRRESHYSQAPGRSPLLVEERHGGG